MRLNPGITVEPQCMYVPLDFKFSYLLHKCIHVESVKRVDPRRASMCVEINKKHIMLAVISKALCRLRPRRHFLCQNSHNEIYPIS